MTLSTAQIRLIKTAAKKLALSDDEYRSALVKLCGVTSCKDLDRDGFLIVMAYFRWLGFDPVAPGGPNYGERPGMASFAQLELIRSLWSEHTGGAGAAALARWLERTFKVTDERFLTTGTAQKAITALLAMRKRPKKTAAA